MPLDDLVLTTSNASARVDLDGGRLASLVVDGLELLITEGDKASRWGSFPMIPWCGRLPYGRLEWAGTVHEMPITSPPHANHGVTHTARWNALDANTIEIALGEPWPLGGRARQRFILGDNSLRVEVEVDNDERDMPAMAGWHPWFRRELDRGDAVVVDLDAGAAYETDDDLVPTGALGPIPTPPWNICVTELGRPTRLTWPGALDLTIATTFDHLVVFTEPDHAVCVEPQSGPPDQFRLDPHTVGPGRSLTGSMTLAWSVHD